MNTFFAKGHAVIVGVGADLPNTIDDAVGIAEILQDESRCAYPSQQVHLLIDKQADRDGILGTLDTLAHTTNEESTVIIYFSGHGYRVTSPTGEFYYLMPYGYDVKQLYKTAISGTEFIECLKVIPAQKLLLLLDCCHAGGVSMPGLEAAKAPMPQETVEFLAQGHGRSAIASSTANELSYAGKPYSAFTLALIEALCGIGVAKQDGYVRVADLALHTREKVPQRTSDKQHPVLEYEQADNFAVAYYAGGDTHPKGLPFDTPPEIEPEPGAFHGTTFDQSNQTVNGPQTNIAGSVNAPVYSGNVQIGTTK